MADQQTTDAIVEGGKAIGSGGGLLALGYMVVNIFKKKVEVDDEREAKALEALVAEQRITNERLGTLNNKVDVMNERLTGVLARVDKNESKLEEAIERLAKLEGAFERLQEQVGK